MTLVFGFLTPKIYSVHKSERNPLLGGVPDREASPKEIGRGGLVMALLAQKM
jgi:hypothetical protein